MPDLPVPAEPAMHNRYWQRTRRLTLQLFLLWLAITVGIVFFARELSGLTLFGWPLSFYLAAQGVLLAYLAIIVVYAWRMRKLDAAFRNGAKDAA